MKRNWLIWGTLTLSAIILSLHVGTADAKGLKENTNSGAASFTLKGKVVGFDDRSMVVRDDFGVDHDLTWDQKTEFLQRDKKVKAKDCKIGSPVELEARNRKGKLHIRRVRINQILQPYIKPATEQATEEKAPVITNEIITYESESGALIIEIPEPKTE